MLPVWRDVKSKDDFFRQLHALDSDSENGSAPVSSDEEDDSQIQQAFNVFKGNACAIDAKTSACDNRERNNLANQFGQAGEIQNPSRSRSFSLTAKEKSPTQRKTPAERTKRDTELKQPPKLKAQVSALVNKNAGAKRSRVEEVSSKNMPPPKKKAKGQAQMPLEKRIFHNRSFFFLPNDNIDQQRRMRIEKVQEYGGSWVRECVPGSTDFVVLERRLQLKDFLKFMKWESCREEICVVDERFIGACLHLGMVLDARRYGFLVGSSQDTLKEAESPARNKPQTPPAKEALKAAEITHRKNSLLMEEITPSPAKRSQETTSSVSMDTPSKWEPKGKVSARGNGDALSQVISEVKRFSHLPIEELDEGSGTEKNHEVDQDVRPKSSHRLNQEAFQCMHRNSGASGAQGDYGPNARTIEILGEMSRYYDRINDSWRTMAYRKAVAALRKCKSQISTKEDAQRIHGIGERIAARIEEIFVTNNLRRLQSTKDDPVDKALQLFTGIYGVGFNRAQQWINAGHRTLEDVSSRVQLTQSQTVGLQRYDDFNQRIPRLEVERHGNIVRDALKAIDSMYEVTVMGSFRRGASDSGDIDLILTKPGVSISDMRSTVMLTLIPRLLNSGFLKAKLTTPRSDSSSKWHGASCVPGSIIWRRIDFLLVPWEERGAALIYFTGNDIFNRSIRLLARKKSMRLNQRGLYKDVMRGKGGFKMTEGQLLEGESERRILEILGVPWRPPQDRNC